MASRNGYTSLPPADSEEGGAKTSAEQPDGAATTTNTAGAEPSSVGARGDEAPGRDATSGSTAKKGASGVETAGKSTEKDAAADPTGERKRYEPVLATRGQSVTCRVRREAKASFSGSASARRG